MDEFYEAFVKLHPLTATFVGDNRYDDKYVGVHTALYRTQLRALVDTYINNTKIGHVIKHILTNCKLGLDKYPTYLTPMNHHYNPFETLILTIEFRRTTDISAFKRRVMAFLETLSEMRANMMEGVDKHIVECKKSIKIAVAKLRHIDKKVHESARVLHNAAKRRAYLDFMRDVFVPAAHDFADFTETMYLPHCKASLACPKGWYTYFLWDNINLRISPDTVYELGLEHVSRIKKQLQLSTDRHTNAKTWFKSRAYMLASYQQCMEERLAATRAIVTVPAKYKLPITEQIPVADEKFEAGAYIMGSDMHNKTPQVFRINTMSWKDGVYSIKNLVQHEVVPGHSLQLYIANQVRIHKAYKLFGFTETVEGWALYAEGLLATMNSLHDEYERLNLLMFRAVRLVCDVGMHHKGWSFNRIHAYMKKHLHNMSDAMIRSEIMRYAANPGQACAYFIGMLKIQELRAKLHHMSDTAFHDAFLKLSNYPLFHIEDVMRSQFQE